MANLFELAWGSFMGSRALSWYQRWARAGLASLFTCWVFSVPAPETDNFSLPLDSSLADLGDYFETVHTLALENAVRVVNVRIERALETKDSQKRTQQLARSHHPEVLVAALLDEFSHSYFETGRIEAAVGGEIAHAAYPGHKMIQKNIWLNFSAHLPLDPRQMMMLVQSGTVKAYGVYFGTDKIIHFHHVGRSYYRDYRAELKTGYSPEEAYRRVIEKYAHHALLSEDLLFGFVTTGIYSNADLAANHAGFKFLLNLTEAVTLNGQECQPLVVRCGVFWRLNQQVRPRSGWFTPYITDHWNEALNPNLYEWTMRPGVRRVLRSRAEQIVKFYTQKDGRPNDPTYFDQLAQELSTYYGEAYGHSGRFEKLMTIGNTCYPALDSHLPPPPEPLIKKE